MSDCWIWTGSVGTAGYGTLWVGGKEIRAHRAAYKLFVGEIPPGYHIHHKCREKLCVNPDHLEALDAAEHARRHNTKTHCLRGHAYDEKNTYVSKTGSRYCRACNRILHYEKYARTRKRSKEMNQSDVCSQSEPC